MGAELPRNSLSVAKEGKVFEHKKSLQPLLGTPEGTKMTGTIFFLTSPTLTVYSTGHAFFALGLLGFSVSSIRPKGIAMLPSVPLHPQSPPLSLKK